MFSIGEYVKIKNSNLYGFITNIKYKENKKLYLLKINNKNVTIDEESIEKTNNEYTNKKIYNVTNSNYTYENTFIPEITIRHQTLDIAMYNVENFINEAIANNAKVVKIIHGRNGGILRKAVHEYLKHNKNVDSFRLGNYYEGSYGVTIIQLK